VFVYLFVTVFVSLFVTVFVSLLLCLYLCLLLCLLRMYIYFCQQNSNTVNKALEVNNEFHHHL